MVDETEKMREELLRAEAELIQLKKMQVEQQILEAKKSLQVSYIIIQLFQQTCQICYNCRNKSIVPIHCCYFLES